MTMNGHRKPGADLPILAEHLPGSEVVEFSLPLHVSKRCGQDGKPDVYTIAIWWEDRPSTGSIMPASSRSVAAAVSK